MQSFYKKGNDIFQTGVASPITQQQFQNYGLNADLISSDPNKPTQLDSGIDTETKQYIAQGGQLGQPNAAAGVITPNSLIPEDQLKLAPYQEAPAYDIQGLDYLNPTTGLTEQEGKQSQLGSEVGSLYNSLVGKSEFQSQQEQQFGVDKAAASINDLGARLTALKNESLAIPVREEMRAADGTFLASGAQANVAQKQREIAVNALGVSSLLAASQGQLANAQALADRAVAQKYDPIFEQIEAKRANLDLIINDPKTKQQDRNRALKLQEKQQEQAQLVAEKAEREENINKIMLQAASVGADPTTLDKIKYSGSLTEAIANAGGFLSAEFRQRQDQINFDNKLKLQNLSLDRARLSLQQQSLAMEKEAALNSEMDEAELLAYAQQFAATGQIPTGLPKGTFGAVSEVAKSLPKESGTLVDRNTGIKPNAGDATIQGYASGFSAIQLAKELKELEKERAGGLVGGTVGKVFGADDQARYLEKRSQIVDLLSRYRSGAALTETEIKKYEEMLPGRFSNKLFLGRNPQDQIDEFVNTLTSDLKNKANAQGWAIYGLSDVEVNGKKYKVGDVLDNGTSKARVNPDGSLMLIQ